MVTKNVTKNIDVLRQEVYEHVAADAVIQGQYWDEESGRGCFIGCLAHSDNPTPAVERFGLTTPILRIAEVIFEKLPPEEARQFFYDFPDAVQCDGKDLSLVHWAFLDETLRHLPPQKPDIQAVIDPVISGIAQLASGGEWTVWAARAARAAARAAEAAALDAEAAGAAEAAWAAANAAINPEVAGWDAVSAAEIRRQRDSLLRLIREAPVVC